MAPPLLPLGPKLFILCHFVFHPFDLVALLTSGTICPSTLSSQLSQISLVNSSVFLTRLNQLKMLYLERPLQSGTCDCLNSSNISTCTKGSGPRQEALWIQEGGRKGEPLLQTQPLSCRSRRIPTLLRRWVKDHREQDEIHDPMKLIFQRGS